ncbi:sensor histidine kinase [Catenovulum sediminis]|uniref:histidine kinase n=1 Tax=Catenovulum sediminis TaxID=1740262 RepID=A0ABV1RK42_9ALTE|nr:sensor histidine kinase [Catenovulum sediminis]
MDMLLEKKRDSWILIFLIVILVISANIFLAINITSKLSKAQTSLYNTGEIISELEELHILVLQAESGQRGYLLTANEEYLTPYTNALENVYQQIETIKTLESEIPEQPAKVASLIHLIEAKLRELVATVELAQADKEKSALRQVMTGRGRNLYKEIKLHFDMLKSIETTYRDDLFAQLLKAEKNAEFTFTTSAITSFLLLFGMMILARILLQQERKNQTLLETQNETLQKEVNAKTQELTVYAEELEQSNRELESFAFVASHDLQEPLRKIRAFGDRLEINYADKLDERGADFIKRMKNAAERMSNLINDLLEYSRISTRGKSFKAVALQEVVDTVTDDLEIAIVEANATIKVAELPSIQADKSQICQLFQNLISNAIKFRRSDQSPLITINYHTETINNELLDCTENWHVITIADNGIGFEQAFADKIFIPFQRLHSRSEYKGTGIGLAVCRRIVERHGGCINVKSQPNEGAIFTIKIPEDYQLPMSDGE